MHTESFTNDSGKPAGRDVGAIAVDKPIADGRRGYEKQEDCVAHEGTASASVSVR